MWELPWRDTTTGFHWLIQSILLAFSMTFARPTQHFLEKKNNHLIRKVFDVGRHNKMTLDLKLAP